MQVLKKRATVDELLGLVNHESQNQTHLLTCQISTKTNLIQCSIVQIIHRDFNVKRLLFSNTLLSSTINFSCIYISQGSVATQLRCGEIFNNHFIDNLSRECANKN